MRRILNKLFIIVYCLFLRCFVTINILQESGEKVERMTGKDAAMFPLFASGFLLGIYIIFKVRFIFMSTIIAHC